MRVLAFFSAVLAVATSYPVVKTWTLTELSDAIVFHRGDPNLKPYLEDALNSIMLALFTGKNEKFIHAVVPSPTGGATWTVTELTNAIADPTTKPEYRPALLQALSFVMERNQTGTVEDSVEVAIPAADISTWTQSDLMEALTSLSTKPDLMPFLEKAYTDQLQAIENGEKRTTVNIVTPVGLITPKADYEYVTKESKHIIKKTKKGTHL